jgi:hypothetical protein
MLPCMRLLHPAFGAELSEFMQHHEPAQQALTDANIA